MSKKVKFNILILVISNLLFSQAPNITAMEYYFDQDPGFGNGTSVSVLPDSLIDENFTVDLSGLTMGNHRFYVRTKDENGKWSLTYKQDIFKSDLTPTIPEPLPDIIAAEYYFDTDPGFGNGTELSVTADSLIYENFAVDLSELTTGNHRFYVRTKDETGKWSLTYKQDIFKSDVTPTIPEPLPDIIAAEYYFDTDPGFGNGTELAVTADILIDENFAVDLSGLTMGNHRFYVRTKDENGKWSFCYIQPIYILSAADFTAGFTADITTGIAPLTVQFTDQSLGNPTIWEWDFENDGIIDSEEQNPEWTYSELGTYSVKLTVSDSSNIDEELREDYIFVGILGCTDPLACNYDDTVTDDDGSCWYPDENCECIDGEGALPDDCGVCDSDPSNDCVLGCTNPDAINYNPDATVDDGSCVTGFAINRPFTSNWNWFSLNVFGDDMTLNTVLGSTVGNAVYIRDQNDFADYVDGFGWFGTLSELGNTSMYMINLSAVDTLEFFGTPVDVTNTPIDVVTGWNWVGYTPQEPIDINTALTSIEGNSDYIRNQNIYAEYVDGFGWFGNLAALEPLDGYKLKMTADDVLLYPESGGELLLSAITENTHSTPLSRSTPDWSVNSSEYEFVGSVTANVMLNETLVGSESDLLAAFVGEECRGVASGLYFPPGDYFVFPLSFYSNESSGEALTFRFYSAENDQICDLDETIDFTPNMTLGSPVTPYTFHGTCEICIPPAWSVNSSEYEFVGSVTSNVFINSELVGSENDQLAAFVGEECRGVANGLYFPPNDYYVFPLSFYSNEPSGEVMSFKFFDSAACEEYDLTETVEFIPNMTLGLPLAPYPLNGGGAVTGCTDPEACNYNPDVSEDDGSCVYNDCFGDCDGTAFIDDCGICAEGSTGIEANICDGNVVEGDCDGDYSGPNWDDCGICFGTSFTDFDSDGLSDECDEYPWGEVSITIASFDNTGTENGILLINYDSEVDIYGFQFNLSGTTLIGGFSNYFPINVSPETGNVIGFSFSGEFLPSGSGELCSLFYEYDESSVVACISELIISADYGLEVFSTIGDCMTVSPPIFDCNGDPNGSAEVDICGICVGGTTGLEPDTCLGCTDPEAINYDPDATIDDGSCLLDDLPILSLGELDLLGQTIEILLENPGPVAGFQFTLTDIPDEIDFISASGGRAEENGFDVQISPVNDVVLGFSLGGDIIPAGDGVLTIISFENCVTTELCLSEGIITQYGGAWVEPGYGDCVDMQVDIGDANFDGLINVGDIVAIVGQIFGTDLFTGCQFWAADISEDGTINVVDIVLLIEMILGEDLAKSEPVTAALMQFGNGYVKLHEQGKVAGIQLTVSGNYNVMKSNLPDSWEFQADGSTILCYSSDGSSLNSNILFEYSGDLIIESALVADWNGNGIYAQIEILPESFTLSQPWPNPFNPVTTIRYELPEDSHVQIRVYDLQGQLITELINGSRLAGTYQVNWDASNQSSSVYLVRMTANDFQFVQKVMLIK